MVSKSMPAIQLVVRRFISVSSRSYHFCISGPNKMWRMICSLSLLASETALFPSLLFHTFLQKLPFSHTCIRKYSLHLLQFLFLFSIFTRSFCYCLPLKPTGRNWCSFKALKVISEMEKKKKCCCLKKPLNTQNP